MKKWWVIAIILAGMASCQIDYSDVYSEPDELLTSEQMVDILTELSVVEAAYQAKYIQVSRFSSLLQKEADSIFTTFKTNRTVFEENMTYYGYEREELREIYQQVKVNLEKRKSEIKIDPDELPETIPVKKEDTIPKILTEEDL